MVRLRSVVFCVVCLFAVKAYSLDQNSKPAMLPGYSAEQASAGKKLYKQHCLSCHPKGYFEQVFRAWRGQPLQDLLGVMRTDMPQSNPGGLSPAVYVNILAYILAENHYPAGPVPLDPATNAFRDIRIAPAPID